MLVDRSKKLTNSYEYALIQYNNISTSEKYNIGVILQDSKKNIYHHIPKMSYDLNNCLDIDNKPAINYGLDKIKDEIDHLNKFYTGNISDALSVSMFRTITTDLSPDNAMGFLVSEFITLKKLRTIGKATHLTKYDKRSVISLITEYAEKKQIKNFVHQRKFSMTVKQIDLAIIDKDKFPISIANVASPHTDNFHDSFISNIFTLQDVNRKTDLKTMFLHAPVYPDMTASKGLSKNIGWAKEQAQNYNIDIILDNRAEAVMEALLIKN